MGPNFAKPAFCSQLTRTARIKSQRPKSGAREAPAEPRDGHGHQTGGGATLFFFVCNLWPPGCC